MSVYDIRRRLQPNLVFTAPRVTPPAGRSAMLVENEASGRSFVTVPAQVVLSGAAERASVGEFMLRLSGRLVEAETANSNGAFWTAGDLSFGLPTVSSGPLNWLHEERKVVGALTSASLVDREAAANGVGPHIASESVLWRWIYPAEAAAVERAAETSSAFYCVDDDTEIMSASGWKHFSDLELGEDILTLNRVSGLSEWMPTDKIHRFDVTDTEMVKMEGQQHSSLTTPGHRWWVDHRRGTGLRGWREATSQTLAATDHIPRAMPHGGYPVDAKYSDDFVELAAWSWTDSSRHGKSLVISQSARGNPAKVARIDALFTRLGVGEHRAENAHGMVTWDLHVAGSRAVLDVMEGDRLPTGAFLRSLTRAQLALFVDVSILADGTVHKDHGQVIFYAEHEAQAKVMEMACALLGQVTNTGVVDALGRKKPSSVNGVEVRANKNLWRVCLAHRSTFIAPLRLARLGKGFTVTREAYTGTVWCPQTPNETFLARRRGSVYWTMNSMECLSRTVQCVGEHGCGAQMPYLDALRRTEAACEHVRERSAVRRFVDPVFLGAAVIVPPVKPGWSQATVEVQRAAAEVAEVQQFGLGETDARAMVEQVMAYATVGRA